MQREELARLLEGGLSLEAIGRRVGRHPSTVSYWLGKHGLTANGAPKYGRESAIDIADLRQLLDRGLAVTEIAQRLESTPSRIRRAMKKAGLASRQERNRRLVRAALARGDRVAALVCLHHGPCDHVLEGRGSYRCMRCRSERVAEHRRRLKRMLVAQAGGCCVVCGYDGHPAAFDFHHLDPSQKSFELSLRGVTRSARALRAEARKCVLLCARCHAEVEAGVTSLNVSVLA
ncbi:MAG: hypothetical protein E6G30_07550 [Actinobacteria bacterium]|nr:MAG: hypothetical protein E6G30_07550 [Actinomycetota bacterium]